MTEVSTVSLKPGYDPEVMLRQREEIRRKLSILLAFIR